MRELNPCWLALEDLTSGIRGGRPSAENTMGFVSDEYIPAIGVPRHPVTTIEIFLQKRSEWNPAE